MIIYVLRHGVAAKHSTPLLPNDSQRPLTPKGIKKMKKIAAAMRSMKLKFDRLWSSSLPRARQTAEIVSEEFKGCRIENVDHLLPEASPEECLQKIAGLRPHPEGLMIVGHEPFLTGLISLLLTGEEDLPIEMKKGGLCQLTVQSFRPQLRARLDWLLTPRQMILMD